MIKYILTVLLSTITFLNYAQTLTLREIIKLKTREPSYVEEFLTAKNWSLYDVTPSTDTQLSIIEFEFKKPGYKGFYCLLAFLHDPEKINSNRIYFNTKSKVLYDNLLKQAKADKYKFIKSNISEGEITKVYSLNGLVIEFSIFVDKAEDEISTLYTVALFSAYDYRIKDKTFKL